MQCTSLDTFKIMAYSALCFFRNIPPYAIIFLTCNEYRSPQKRDPPKSVTPSVLNFFNPPPPSPQTFYSPLRLEMAASAFFTHGYFQQAHVHISEAIITD